MSRWQNPAVTAGLRPSDISRVHEVIAPYIRRTPVLHAHGGDAGLGSFRLTLKLEFMQHAGSFKARGAFTNLLTRLVPPPGVVAASGGNHGVAVAYAAMRLGIPARIFVPTVAAPAKVARIRAYGADVVITADREAPSRRWLVAGIERADSIATDGHKWLVPYDCGIALTAHPEAHQHSLLMPAHYIQMTSGEREPRAFTPDESRRARAVPLYAALRALGRDGVGEIVERCCTLAVRMASRLASHDHVRILNDVVLNQVLVQFRPPGADDTVAAALTQEVIARVQEEGTCWAGGTKWHGQVAMRLSISNWTTTAEDIDRSAAAIISALTAAATRLATRPAGYRSD